MDQSANKVNVDQLVLDIRQRVRHQAERVASSAAGDATEIEAARASTLSLSGVESAIARLEAQAAKIGRPTPETPTLRGRTGASAMRLLGRLLWWYTHEIQGAFSGLVRLHHEELKAIGNILKSADADRARVASVTNSMNERLRSVESAQSGPMGADLDRRFAEIQSQRATDQALQRKRDSEIRDLHTALADLREEGRKSLREASAARELCEVVKRESAAHLDELDAGLRGEMAGLRGEMEVPRGEMEVLRGELATLSGELATLRGELATLRCELDATKASAGRETAHQLDNAVEAHRRQAESLDARARQISSEISSLGLLAHRNRADLSLQDRRISLFIEEARKRLPAPFDAEHMSRLSALDDHKYDSMYVAFEDVFRGSREEIKARQSKYLPLLQQHHIGTADMPLLDVGCGRGEWLEVLRDNNLVARGIDRNETMVEHCRAAALQVELGDALKYLRSLPAQSLGAVTSFHLVEHLPFDIVLALVDECLRVLRTGGILILETPNPQNLLVGASTFYLDPTHLRPLPSPMLRFFVEARGFCNVQVRDLHPYHPSIRLPDNVGDVAVRLNDYLYGPQDYAVIGIKA